MHPLKAAGNCGPVEAASLPLFPMGVQCHCALVQYTARVSYLNQVCWKFLSTDDSMTECPWTVNPFTCRTNLQGLPTLYLDSGDWCKTYLLIRIDFELFLYHVFSFSLVCMLGWGIFIFGLVECPLIWFGSIHTFWCHSFGRGTRAERGVMGGWHSGRSGEWEQQGGLHSARHRISNR